MSDPCVSDIVGILRGKQDQYLADLKTLVNIDSGTFDVAGVNEVGSFLSNRYAAMGATVEIVPGTTYGHNFIASFVGKGRGKVLLIGHTDTVFPRGTAASRPFRVEGARAYGPGTADMKGGDLCIVFALEALHLIGWDNFESVQVLHNSDEEVGSPSSRDIVRNLASKAGAVLVLEPGRENGNIVSGRKGIADGRVQVTGVASHAGVNHDKGRSAVLELAHIVTGLESLNGTVDGATLNVGHIRGGERINVVPDEAFAHFEIRAYTEQNLEEMIARARDVVRRRTVTDTGATVDITIEHVPMFKSEASTRLVSLAQDIAKAIGFTVHDVATGGASDGNTAAAAGIPVLDGLGPVGGGAHSLAEYIEISSVVQRTGLLAGLVTALGSGVW
ncbi:MAG: M20 family metallopeptidase [Acidobacteriaceae bacterium]